MDLKEEIAAAKRVIYDVRHIARDGYKWGHKDACERIMKRVDEYGATRGLKE